MCAVSAQAAAGATLQNRVSGRASSFSDPWSFTATSGPHGEAVTGEIQGGPDRFGPVYSGWVTCLSVNDYRAVIGGTAIWTRDGIPLGAPQPFLIVAVDNSSPKQRNPLVPGSPPDQFAKFGPSGPSAAPGGTNDCSLGGGVKTAPLTDGDVFVRDARDKPPRISLPKVRITVRTRQRVRVRYRVTAKDDFDRHPTLRCSPASGSRFRIGATRVRCTARDRSGLRRTATFFVHLKFRRR